VSDDPVLPVRAWPGLQAGDSGIDLRLFATADTARRSTLAGYQQLIELALQKDLAWMQKDLRALAQHQELAAGFCSIDGLQETAFVHLKRSLLPSEVPTALTEANFRAAVDSVRARIPGLAVQLIDRVGLILTLRRDVQRKCGPVVAVKPKTAQKLSALDQLSLPSPGAKPPENSWAAELDALIPPNFLAATSPAQLPQLPRYLKALATRMERAGVNPLKDRERAKLLAPYLSAWQKLREKPPESPEARAQIEELRWMIEEFKVSIFAQELGTAFPISAARLDQHLLKIRR
jgi:ATP-dependent helicase HrpA